MKILPRAVVCLGVGGAIAAATPSLTGTMELDGASIIANNSSVERCVTNLGEGPKQVDVLPEACETFGNSFSGKNETLSLGASASRSAIKYQLPSASTFKQDHLITPESTARNQQQNNQKNREIGYVLGVYCAAALFVIDTLGKYTKPQPRSKNNQSVVA